MAGRMRLSLDRSRGLLKFGTPLLLPSEATGLLAGVAACAMCAEPCVWLLHRQWGGMLPTEPGLSS